MSDPFNMENVAAMAGLPQQGHNSVPALPNTRRTGVKRTFANGRPVAAGANKESVTVGNARTAATDSFGTSTAGAFGFAAAGPFGTATAGDNGYAVSRDYGLSVSGERGVSVVGLGGIAAAGVGGVLVFETYQPGGGGGLDVKSFGVDGETVKADTPYKLDYRKNLVEATDEVWQGGV